MSENLRRVRKLRDVSLRDLEESLDRAGHPLGYNALSRIEKGQRRVDVDDLTALAFVLDVSPLALLLPISRASGDPAPLTGNVSATAEEAWLWALTKQPLNSSDVDSDTGVTEPDSARVHEFRSQKPWWLGLTVEVFDDPEAVDGQRATTVGSRIARDLDAHARFVEQLESAKRGAGMPVDSAHG